jgi:hypothetical protein
MGGDLGEFGLVNFDWSNNRATWSGANGKSKGNMCEQDLIAQCKITKASSARHPGPETKTLVYRGGEMSLNYMADQIAVMGDLATNPHDTAWAYKGFFVSYNNGTTWVCKAGHCFNQLIWDFRNQSARDYYVNTVVGSADYGIGNPVVSGMLCVRPTQTECPVLARTPVLPPPHPAISLSHLAAAGHPKLR